MSVPSHRVPILMACLALCACGEERVSPLQAADPDDEGASGPDETEEPVGDPPPEQPPLEDPSPEEPPRESPPPDEPPPAEPPPEAPPEELPPEAPPPEDPPPDGAERCQADAPLRDAGELFFAEPFEADLPACAAERRIFVAAAGTRVRLDLEALAGVIEVELLDARGEILATAEGPSVALDLELPASGAVSMHIRRRVGEGDVFGELSCVALCDLEATRHPIVLVHGAGATGGGDDLALYFVGVRDRLEDLGYRVYTPATRAIAHSEARAGLLARYLDDLFDETGAEKVHLIGHSQGGLDLRVLSSPDGFDYGDRIASMTSIATPHRGIRIPLIDWFPGMDFSEAYLTTEFPARWPEAEGIPTFSWAGRTCGRGEAECRARNRDEVVTAVLGAQYWTIKSAHADDAYQGDNDGLVPVESSIWGELLGALPADHLDQIAPLGGPFDHRAFFVEEARRLRALELERGL